MGRIVVVGSLNHDTTVFVPRLPAPGETVLGKTQVTDTGGKGANQAVAASRLGADVSMVGRVGADGAGRTLLDVLDRENIDHSSVVVDPGLPTGAAFITVDEAGENTIVVNSGANAALTVADLPEQEIRAANVVLAQLESPIGVIIRAAELCEGTFILNPAPAAPLDQLLLGLVDILVPNRTELAVLANLPPAVALDDVMRAVRIVGANRTVVTLGSEGALVVVDGNYIHVQAPKVESVDPTAAGDAFCGALAAGLCRGLDMDEAARWAVLAGAATVTKAGAQSALPTIEDIEALDG